MSDFLSALHSGPILVSDGAFGTELQKRGLPAGMSPEEFGLQRPEVVRDIHLAYCTAGARVATTNTFGGTRFKMPGMDVVAFNREMASVAREAFRQNGGPGGYVLGSVGPTGLFVKPMGDLDFADLVDAFREQIRGLVQGGADFIMGETHFDLAEAKAVAVAARLECDLPVGVSMTYEGNASLTGTSPEVFVDTMRNLGVDLIGVNCSAGPDEILELVRTMLPRLDIPMLVYPNAGLPELKDGETVFPMGPDEFAHKMLGFLDLGVRALGGCCGTSPDHIAALAKAVEGKNAAPLVPDETGVLVLTTRSKSVVLGPNRPTAIIGERINPTGKKQLTAELQAGQFATALRFGEEQVQAGAPILDVNVGAPMVDETVLLPDLVGALASRFDTPLAIDSSNPDAVAAALPAYPGSPLVNSISGDPGRMETLGPLCALHGAPFILLPIKGRKLPVTAADRIAIIEELLAQADELGVPRHLAMVDVLALTVSSKPDAAKHCMDTIRHCRDVLGLTTVCGLSNISFGLPARDLINSTFLSMAMASGMSACIANPGSARMREALAAGEVLLGRDPQAGSFIDGYSDWTPGSGSTGGGAGSGGSGKADKKPATLEDAVIRGDLDNIQTLIKKALEEGMAPYTVVDEKLIPAITEVGGKYERKEYFLPQLIRSAETMQKGFEVLKPLLEADATGEKRAVCIMATVEGDIHDIGKNIVCLMLRNHGFEVVDLGKDVPAERIVEEAEKHGASLIGLSALMTTTMVRMEDTVRLVAERGLDCKIMIGGAVITGPFADSIGAHGWSTDAVDAVRTAKTLVASLN